MAGSLTKPEATAELIRRGITPRVLDLDLAAAYVGLCADAFLAAVADGLYPMPIAHGRRRQWDRLALDRALDRRSKLDAHSPKQETPDAIMAAIDAA